MPDEGLDDVPSAIDLRELRDAHEWVSAADTARPWRKEYRAAFAEIVSTWSPRVRRALELGAGPGLLAHRVLRDCAVESYTLFDFSPPMLDLSRALLGGHPAARFVLGDFKQPDWARSLASPFDAILAMQAVHELRHKRHLPGLYRQLHGLLSPGGLVLVCDHAPWDDNPRWTALHATEAEQHAALTSAGFAGITTYLRIEGMYLCGGHRPA